MNGNMTMRAKSFPHCPRCGAVARPNILMFCDFAWISRRSAEQQHRFDHFLTAAVQPTAVLELGAGKAVPTIRHLSEGLAASGCTRIRINPREAQVPSGHHSLPLRALEGLRSIESVLA